MLYFFICCPFFFFFFAFTYRAMMSDRVSSYHRQLHSIVGCINVRTHRQQTEANVCPDNHMVIVFIYESDDNKKRHIQYVGTFVDMGFARCPDTG